MGVANISGNILTDSGASLSSYLPLTGGTLTGALTGTSAQFNGATLKLVNSSGSADFTLDRANTSSGAAVNLNTNGTNKWFFGLRGLVDDNFYIYNQTAAANNLILNASTGAATFSSSVSATTGLFSYTGSASYGLTITNTSDNLRLKLGTTTGGYLNIQGQLNNNGNPYNISLQADGGNVGIGTSSPSAISTFTTLDIRGATGGGIRIGKTSVNPFNLQQDGTDAYLNNTANGAMYFYTNDTERMRITSGGFTKISVDGTYLSTGAYHEMRSNAVGNLAVFQQTASSGVLYGVDVYYSGQAPNNTTSTFITFYDNVNTKAIIYSNGTFGSRTSTYGGISDIKLKENITPATNKLDDLLKVNVVNYNFIDDENKEKQLGVIAQELEEIFPNMVFETEDKESGEKHKNVKYSIFVPMLIKAIQEQQEIINQLSAKVTALENK